MVNDNFITSPDKDFTTLEALYEARQIAPSRNDKEIIKPPGLDDDVFDSQESDEISDKYPYQVEPEGLDLDSR